MKLVKYLCSGLLLSGLVCSGAWAQSGCNDRPQPTPFPGYSCPPVPTPITAPAGTPNRGECNTLKRGCKSAIKTKAKKLAAAEKLQNKINTVEEKRARYNTAYDSCVQKVDLKIQAYSTRLQDEVAKCGVLSSVVAEARGQMNVQYMTDTCENLGTKFANRVGDVLGTYLADLASKVAQAIEREIGGIIGDILGSIGLDAGPEGYDPTGQCREAEGLGSCSQFGGLIGGLIPGGGDGMTARQCEALKASCKRRRDAYLKKQARDRERACKKIQTSLQVMDRYQLGYKKCGQRRDVAIERLEVKKFLLGKQKFDAECGASVADGLRGQYCPLQNVCPRPVSGY